MVTILTTTPTVEGRTITEYRGVVFGEVIAGIDVLTFLRIPELVTFFKISLAI